MNRNPAKSYKILAIGLILSLFILISPTICSNSVTYPIINSNVISLKIGDGPINLTVNEAWGLLSDTSNGIQIPIDIRSEDDWNESFIDTPWPEHPRWIGDIDNFMEEFDGREVVIYCKGGYRSLLFCYQYSALGFNGTLYNLGGGFTAWVDAGLPIRNNTPPEAPEIKEVNPRYKPINGFKKTFKFTTIDPDEDKIFLYIIWDDGTFEEWIGPYNSSEEVTISHLYNEQGTQIVRAKAKDIFEDEGPWGELKIPIDQNRQSYNSFFSYLFNRFPFLEVFLRIINF